MLQVHFVLQLGKQKVQFIKTKCITFPWKEPIIKSNQICPVICWISILKKDQYKQISKVICILKTGQSLKKSTFRKKRKNIPPGIGTCYPWVLVGKTNTSVLNKRTLTDPQIPWWLNTDPTDYLHASGLRSQHHEELLRTRWLRKRSLLQRGGCDFQGLEDQYFCFYFSHRWKWPANPCSINTDLLQALTINVTRDRIYLPGSSNICTTY